MKLLDAALNKYTDEGFTSLVTRTSNFAKRSFRNHIIGSISNWYLPGVPIYEPEWDLLIVLDSCRVDLMREVQHEYDYIEKICKINSVGTKTTEWMKNNFTKEYRTEMENTVYVAGNPNSARFLDQSTFSTLDEVWQYAWDEELGTIPGRPITDRATAAGRAQNPDRMIVHYMQPHEPFISDPTLGGQSSVERISESSEKTDFDSIWSRLRRGELKKKEVWKLYRDNLRYILDEVELLLHNIEAETTVITSDHGNAVGEFGQYGHPAKTPLKCLKQVPWIVTRGRDDGEYQPTTERGIETGEEISQKLKQLGYL